MIIRAVADDMPSVYTVMEGYRCAYCDHFLYFIGSFIFTKK